MGRRGRLKKWKEEATLRRIYYLVNDVVRYRDYLYDRLPSKLYTYHRNDKLIESNRQERRCHRYGYPTYPTYPTNPNFPASF
jgi:hypothetical protein